MPVQLQTDREPAERPVNRAEGPALAASALLHPIAWLFGYRDVPRRSRLSFRVDFQSQLLWAALMTLAQAKVCQAIARNSMDAGPMIMALLFAAGAAGNINSFFWAWLASGWRSVRFILVPSTLAGLFAIAVMFVPASKPMVFTLLIVGMHLSMSGVVSVRSAVWHLNYHREGVGNIVSRFQMSGLIVAGLLAFAASRLLQSQPASYRILFPVFGLCGILAGLLCQRTRLTAADDPMHTTQSQATSLLAGWRILRLDHAYRRFLTFMMIFGFGTMMGDAVLVQFLGQRFHAGIVRSTIYLVVVPQAVTLLTMPFAGKLLDRTNPMRLRVFGAAAWCTGQALVFTAAAVGSLPILVISQLFAGLGGGLGAIAWQLGHMHFARRDLVQHYMGLHVSATGLRGMIAPFLAMALWSGATLPAWAGGLHIPRIGPAVFVIGMALQITGGLGFLWMDRRYKALSPLGPEVAV